MAETRDMVQIESLEKYFGEDKETIRERLIARLGRKEGGAPLRHSAGLERSPRRRGGQELILQTSAQPIQDTA